MMGIPNDQSVSSVEMVAVRPSYNYEDLSGQFRLLIRSYDKQFSNIYVARTAEFRSRLEHIVKKKWAKKLEKLSNLNNKKGEKCVIFGTLYKHQELKPSILQEVSKEYQTVPPPKRTHFVSEKDELILEDENQRVGLTGILDTNSVVTGCVVALYGHLLPSGIFQVEDYCWPQVEPGRSIQVSDDGDKFLVLISGIELASAKDYVPLQLFVDWVTGWTGVNNDNKQASKLVHVLLAGNCIRRKPHSKPKYGTNVDYAEDIEAVKELDYLTNQLIENIDVDVMPGEFDPTNHTFPQQPLHRCLFPQSSKYSTFRPVSNPHAFRIENRLVLGTSGQPIEDIKRYSELTDPLDILERTLEWAHLAPTAPDTLPCYPFDGYDPFLIKERPHIYFAGNQPKFQTKMKTYDSGPNVRLICIPSFSNNRCCILVNLKNLDCRTISFNTKKN